MTLARVTNASNYGIMGKCFSLAVLKNHVTISSKFKPLTPAQELKAGFTRFQSVIWALYFKEFKIRLGKSKTGIIWVLLEPVIAMVVISTIWLIIRRKTIENVHVMLYIGSGFIIYLIVRRGITPIPQGIKSNSSLLNYPGVKPIDTIFARFILEMWLHMIASILLFASLFWILGIHPTFPDPLLCFQAIGIAAMLSLGIGLLLGIYGTFYESVGKTVRVFTQPLMIMSGVIYSMNDLPQRGREALSWNPIVHLISAFRQGAFGTKPFAEYDLLYAVYLSIFILGISFIAYYANRFRLIQK